MEEQTNQIFTKKNILSFLVIGILLLSIPFGVKLALEQTQLRSKAANTEITFVPGDTVKCTTTNSVETCTTTSDTVPIELRSPLGPPGAALTPTPTLTLTPIPTDTSTTIPDCTSLTTTADLNNLQVGTNYTFNLTASGSAPITHVEMSVYDGASCSASGMSNLKPYLALPVNGPGTYSITWTPTKTGSFIAYGRVWNDGIAECRSDCVDGVPRYLCQHASACKLTGTVKGGNDETAIFSGVSLVKSSVSNNLLRADMQNATITISNSIHKQEVQWFVGNEAQGTFSISGSATNGGVIQVDEWTPANVFVATHPNNSTFTTQSGNNFAFILRK